MEDMLSSWELNTQLTESSPEEHAVLTLTEYLLSACLGLVQNRQNSPGFLWFKKP